MSLVSLQRVFNISRVRAKLQSAMDGLECPGDVFVSKVWT